MSANVFVRVVDLEAIKDLPLSNYDVKQLTAYLIQNYPNDPIGALSLMVQNLEVGYVVSSRVRLILERVGYDKRS